MSAISPPPPVAVLDSAVVWTGDCLQLARPSPITAPTPCREWDLERLLHHMEDSFTTLAQAAELGHVDLDEAVTGGGPDNVIDRLLRRACRTRALWHRRLTSAPISVGDLPLGRDTVLLVGALEIAVHGWDVARATGQRRPLPEDLAVRLYDVAQAVVTPEERGPRFGPVVPTDADASVSARLLAHLGRDADWAPDDHAG